MRTVSLTIPDHINIDEPELKIILAGELYERERLSLGQAAELAGLSKRAFIEILGKFGFSIFSQSEEDLLSDIENA
jgi:predicted HTH domain antitoxin